MKNKSHIIIRYVSVGLCILLFSGLICYRLVDTTVVHSREWNDLAMKELSRTEVIPPKRGNLLAADGRILAANRRVYTLRVDFTSEQFRFEEYRKNLPALADSMARYFPRRDAKGWRDRLNEPLDMYARMVAATEKEERKKLHNHLRAWPLVLKVESGMVDRIKTFPFFSINNSAKTGLVAEPEDLRVRPFGTLAARSIGIVGQDTASPERRGRSGLEGSLDSLLYGVPGVTKKVPLTKQIGNWTDVPATPGYNITTTIDIDIQDIVETELMRMLMANKAEWGSAVLMEVETGNIRAISNFQSDHKGGYAVCINRIFSPYEPGSVMKPVSMLVALESGIVTSVDQTFPGHGGKWPYPNAGSPIQDTHPMNNVPVNLILPFSSNIATAEMIMSRWRHNPQGFVDRLYEDLGYHELLNVGIKGETLPVIKENPSAVDLSRIAYGYTSAIPPIYTLSVYNAIANDGKMVRPRLYTRLERTDTVIDLPVSYVRERVCSPEHAAMLRKMLRDVVVVPRATGYNVLHTCPVPLAGKTGTCYVIENGRYNKSKKRVSFCGYFPADKPKYSCFVFMEWPKMQYMGAASASGQVMKSIALKLHARGLLDNSSDYTADTHPGVPAALNAQRPGSPGYDALRRELALNGALTAAPPAPFGPGMVPDVGGLNLRDAVSELEDAGFNVEVSGDGFVVEQSPAAGTDSVAGATVSLRLATVMPML